MNRGAKRIGRQSLHTARSATLAVLLAACASSGGGTPGGGRPPAGAGAGPMDGGMPGRRGDVLAPVDMNKMLQSLGVLSSGLPLPFSGTIAALPGTTPDSTLVLVSISMPTIGLTFQRENDRFRGGYSVAIEVRSNGSVLNRVESTQTVRVVSYKETQRGEESVLFQQPIAVAPGTYTIGVLIKDGSSSRSSTQEAQVTIPRFGDRPSTPIIVQEARPRSSATDALDLIANTRNTLVVGRETELPLYVEVRDTSAAGVPLNIAVRDNRNAVVWQDSVVMPRRIDLASAVIRVPVTPLGFGTLTAQVWRPRSADTASLPLLISFGEDLPIASFDDIVSYLRFFASAARLNALRMGPPEQRAAAWANFMRETDPISVTPQNEALRDYFQRIRIANQRFREDGTGGWLSDRGSAFVALGEPDRMLDQNGNLPQETSMGQRGRLQVWDYTGERLRLIFVDQNGFGRWRFYGSSLSDFQAALQRRLNR
jgi:GWxTD domain-containing protein